MLEIVATMQDGKSVFKQRIVEWTGIKDKQYKESSIRALVGIPVSYNGSKSLLVRSVVGYVSVSVESIDAAEALKDMARCVLDKRVKIRTIHTRGLAFLSFEEDRGFLPICTENLQTMYVWERDNDVYRRHE